MANHNYHSILYPISIGVDRADGSYVNVLIQHNLIQDRDSVYSTTGIFNLFLDDFGLNKNEFDDSLESENLDLQNPDYLGKILFDNEGNGVYDGDILGIDEQEQIGKYIKNYKD